MDVTFTNQNTLILTNVRYYRAKIHILLNDYLDKTYHVDKGRTVILQLPNIKTKKYHPLKLTMTPIYEVNGEQIHLIDTQTVYLKNGFPYFEDEYHNHCLNRQATISLLFGAFILFLEVYILNQF